MRRFAVWLVVFGLALAGCSSGGATPTASQGGNPTSTQGGDTPKPTWTNETPVGSGLLHLNIATSGAIERVTIGNGICSAGPGGGYFFAGFGDYKNAGNIFDDSSWSDKDWFSLYINEDGHIEQAGGKVGLTKIWMDNATTGAGNKDRGGSFRGKNSLRSETIWANFTCGAEPTAPLPTPTLLPTTTSLPTPTPSPTQAPSLAEPTRTPQGVMTMLAGTVQLPGSSLDNFPGEVLLYGVKSHQVRSRAELMGGGRYSFDSVTGPEPGAYQALVDLHPILAVMTRNDCYDVAVPAGWGLYYLDDNGHYVQAVGIVSYRGLRDYLFPGAMIAKMPPVYAGSDPVNLNYFDTVQLDLELICEGLPS